MDIASTLVNNCNQIDFGVYIWIPAFVLLFIYQLSEEVTRQQVSCNIWTGAMRWIYLVVVRLRQDWATAVSECGYRNYEELSGKG